MSALVEKLSETLRGLGLMVVTAESCTGGMIGAAFTDLAGSSDVFERGFITYSNEAKREMLKVSADTLRTHGAVSAETAVEMARGALAHSRAEIAVSVTGIAGPARGSDDKPVGLVFIAYGRQGELHCSQHHFTGDRQDIRNQTVQAALSHVLQFVQNMP